MLAKASKPLIRDKYKRDYERNKDSGDTMTQQFNITLHIAAQNGKTKNQIKKALLNGLENQELENNNESAAMVEVNEK